MLLKWLKEQSDYPKVYIADGFKEIAAVGCKKEYDSLPIDSNELVFGGMDFYPYARKSALWEDFPPSYFFVPQKLQQGSIIKQGNYSAPPQSIKHSFTYPKYEEAVETLLKGDLQKAVLARMTTCSFSEPIDPYVYLESLAGRGLLFFFQMNPDSTFLGATPEWLFRRDGQKFSTAAIAGTRVRGRGQELLESKKDLEEFAFVRDELQRALSSLCEEVRSLKKPQILQTPNVEHLFTSFQADLKEDVSDQDLLDALHPTPATGGVPKKNALETLYNLETFDRGWYAAPVGYVSKKQTHLLVAIRSALIRKNELHLFAGSGIVSGSKPEQEWKELNNKLTLWTM